MVTYKQRALLVPADLLAIVSVSVSYYEPRLVDSMSFLGRDDLGHSSFYNPSFLSLAGYPKLSLMFVSGPFHLLLEKVSLKTPFYEYGRITIVIIILTIFPSNHVWFHPKSLRHPA